MNSALRLRLKELFQFHHLLPKCHCSQSFLCIFLYRSFSKTPKQFCPLLLPLFLFQLFNLPLQQWLFFCLISQPRPSVPSEADFCAPFHSNHGKARSQLATSLPLFWHLFTFSICFQFSFADRYYACLVQAQLLKLTSVSLLVFNSIEQERLLCECGSHLSIVLGPSQSPTICNPFGVCIQQSQVFHLVE